MREITPCDVSPNCFECPLVMCKHEDPNAYQLWKQALADMKVLSLLDAGLTKTQAAKTAGVLVRQVHRICERTGRNILTGQLPMPKCQHCQTNPVERRRNKFCSKQCSTDALHDVRSLTAAKNRESMVAGLRGKPFGAPESPIPPAPVRPDRPRFIRKGFLTAACPRCGGGVSVEWGTARCINCGWTR
jgi:hypothetical protein